MTLLQKFRFLTFLLFISSGLQACSGSSKNNAIPNPDMNAQPEQKTDTAYLAAGCFWCIEAIFQQLDGVLSVSSGYTAGLHRTNRTCRSGSHCL
jgi:peptide-methionine (S)-S-oxide reductase